MSESAESEPLFQKKYWKPILIAFFVATFNQLSGINAINYYAPRILETAGVFRESALLQSIFIGLTNLVFTMLGMVLIDKFGRKTCSTSLRIHDRGPALRRRGIQIRVARRLLHAIFADAVYRGVRDVARGGDMGSDFGGFPHERARKGAGFRKHDALDVVRAADVGFPTLVESGLSVPTFCFFALMAALTFAFAMKLPVTKNKSLEEIQRELT